MKKVAAVAIAVLAATAYAKGKQPEQIAHVFSRNLPTITYGGTIPREDMVVVLYEKKPCNLPLTSARDMYAAEYLVGRALVQACWGRIVSPTKAEVMVITKYGDSKKWELTTFATSHMNPDGSATALHPAMTYDDVRENIKRYHEEISKPTS